MMRFFFCTLIISMWLLPAVAAKLPLEQLKLPAGFKISVYAEVPNARSLAQAPDGRIFVGTRAGDQVYVVENGKTSVFADRLDFPNGVAVRDGKLYVAEVSRVLEFDISKKGKQKPLRALPQTFPKDTHHGWKFIRFGPDGMLYVPVGANCNICDLGADYGRIYRIDVKGTSKTVVAEGVRNTVGFDWSPVDKSLWFTDNGRDWLGDDTPPDELNHLTKEGEHFGFPYCHGKSILDPEFGKGKNCKSYKAPEAELRAHVAALGMRFYTGSMFPADYHGAIILAEHGSWNRSQPQGYRLTLAKIKDGQVVAVEPFVEGWLRKDGSVWGRPVDVEVLKDGAMLVSDDKAGVVYKIIYQRK